MGNCHKKNKVEPLVVKDSASEIISRGSQLAKPDGEQQEDMVNALKYQGEDAIPTGGGVSFNVDFKPVKKSKRRRKIKKRAQTPMKPKIEDKQDDLPVYSSEERALMAEILRDDHLNERREKARCVDFKLHDAKLRRMFRAAQAEALEKERAKAGSKQTTQKAPTGGLPSVDI